MLRKASLLLFPILAVFHTTLSASPVINTEDHPVARIEMNELIPDHQATHAEVRILKKNESRLYRFENIMHRLSTKKSRHSKGLFSDPVNKWFWIWLVTWGFGALVLVVSSGGVASPAIGIIWLLAFAIGSISLIIWLLKKFG
ncbi:MAG: hypothetical protein ABJC12_11020 [Saprospiraceae bacterium]